MDTTKPAPSKPRQNNQHPLHPIPAEYSTQLTLNIDNVVIPTVKNPKILGLIFDPKLTYNSHIRKTSDKARNTLKLLKALTSTKWGKQKETIVATYKAITRPILEYVSTISHQSPEQQESLNSKQFRTWHSELQLDAHLTQTSNTYTMKPTYYH